MLTTRMLNIEFARRQRGLSQHELAQTTRIAAHFISLVENGRGIPTEDQARRLARALGVAPDQLLEHVVVAPPVPVADRA